MNGTWIEKGVLKDLSKGSQNYFDIDKDDYQFRIPILPVSKMDPTYKDLLHNEIWNDSIFSRSVGFDEYRNRLHYALMRNYGKDKNIEDGSYGEKQPYVGYVHVCSIFAEDFITKWAGEEIKTDVYSDHGDNGDFADGLGEIKTSTWVKNPDITLKFNQKKDWIKTTEKNKSIVYVLARVKDGFLYGLDYLHVEIIGWTSSERFKLFKKEVWRHGHFNWEVSPPDLVRLWPDNVDILLDQALRDNNRITAYMQQLANENYTIEQQIEFAQNKFRIKNNKISLTNEIPNYDVSISEGDLCLS